MSQSLGPSRAPAALKVLIVVDDLTNAANLVDYLALRGHSVDVAYDGQAAIQRFGREAQDVILLDLGLPDMSGYDVLEQMIRDLEEQPSDGDRSPTRFIALTGYCDEQDRARTREAGFHLHFAKPVDMEDLLQAIAGETQTGIEAAGTDSTD